MIEWPQVQIRDVAATKDTLTVELADGRTVSVPLEWYPRLAHGASSERQNWRLVGGGVGIHWPELDEDISAENLLLGQPSGESQRSLSAWLQGRKRRRVYHIVPGKSSGQWRVTLEGASRAVSLQGRGYRTCKGDCSEQTAFTSDPPQ